MNRNQFGGLLSLLALIAAVVFFALAAASVTLGTVPLVPLGLACGFGAFVLQRLGL